MRILCLEDFEPHMHLIQQYMKSTDHEFSAAYTLEEATAYLKQKQPDIFLVDIIVQGELSYGVIEFAVQEHRARHVVAMTARALPSDKQKYLELGCKKVLAKPFTIDELEQTLDLLS
jgi:CheY-like chemotaxis protein